MYVVYGGTVRSANGNITFVTSENVRKLYNVQKDQCIEINNVEDYHKLRGLHGTAYVLRPKTNGDYNLRNVTETQHFM